MRVNNIDDLCAYVGMFDGLEIEIRMGVLALAKGRHVLWS